MKRIALLVLCAIAVAVSARAQEMNVVGVDGQVTPFALADIDSITFATPGTSGYLCVHTPDGVTRFLVSALDSVGFTGTTVMTVHPTSGSATPFDLTTVDSLTFSASPGTVLVAYDGTTATVDNPFSDEGVAVSVSGADVTVTSTATLPGIVYELSGTTTDGMFKIYSNEDFTLALNGVGITNANGPAINVQAGVTIGVDLVDGTSSVLTDGATYASAPTGEDQKAAFFSEGQLVFTGGTGSVTVNGYGTSAHGLCSDDCIRVESGTITVARAVKDAIHTNEGYVQTGGTVSVTGSSDGVDAGDGPVTITYGSLAVVINVANKDALKCTYDLAIAGGVVDLTVGGNQSKGLRAANISQTGGTVTIHTSGAAVLTASGSGYDPSYCTAVKADTLVDISGGLLTMVTTGTAGRGISCDGDIVVSGGTVNVTSSGGGGTYTNTSGVLDAYTGPCLNADGDLVLSGGTITLVHSGAGGKGISGDGRLTLGTTTSSPTIQVTTTGSAITIGTTGEYAEAKGMSVDSLITITNGAITIAAVDDAIKSKYWIDLNGGTVNITSSLEGLEAPNLFINGGTLHLVSSDDGLNATYGVDSEASDGSNLTISGGYVYLNAPTGDGIDSNGNLTVSGGTIIVQGPPTEPEVGLDVNGTFLVNGGFSIVSQAYGMMIESPSASSTQRTVLLQRSSSLAAGTLFHIETSTGTSLVTFEPAHAYSSILFSSSSLTAGTTYRVYVGGTCTGTEVDGIYTGGTYSGGTLRTTFTLNSVVQNVTF